MRFMQLDNLQTDPLTERRGGMFGLDVFVPADERISQTRFRELISASLHTMVHSIIPESRSLFREESDNFDSFYEIRQLFSCNTTPLKDKDKLDFKELKKKLSNEELGRVFSERKKNLMSFPLPQIIAGDFTTLKLLLSKYVSFLLFSDT